MDFASPVTMLITPAGMPAISRERPRPNRNTGQLGGLQTTVQPAASAAPILRESMEEGKFHGVMAATTPTGSLVTRCAGPARARGWSRHRGAAPPRRTSAHKPPRRRSRPWLPPRLALFGGEDTAQLFLVREKQVRELVEQRRALGGRLGPPGGEGGGGGFDGARVSAPPASERCRSVRHWRIGNGIVLPASASIQAPPTSIFSRISANSGASPGMGV